MGLPLQYHHEALLHGELMLYPVAHEAEIQVSYLAVYTAHWCYFRRVPQGNV
jgi:hypothetical protein